MERKVIRKFKFEAFIIEVTSKHQKHYPVFEVLRGVHFIMYAESKKEVAEKVAEIISTIVGQEVTSGPEPYLSSVLEWTFDTADLDITFGIEKM